MLPTVVPGKPMEKLIVCGAALVELTACEPKFGWRWPVLLSPASASPTRIVLEVPVIELPASVAVTVLGARRHQKVTPLAKVCTPLSADTNV